MQQPCTCTNQRSTRKELKVSRRGCKRTQTWHSTCCMQVCGWVRACVCVLVHTIVCVGACKCSVCSAIHVFALSLTSSSPPHHVQNTSGSMRQRKRCVSKMVTQLVTKRVTLVTYQRTKLTIWSYEVTDACQPITVQIESPPFIYSAQIKAAVCFQRYLALYVWPVLFAPQLLIN